MFIAQFDHASIDLASLSKIHSAVDQSFLLILWAKVQILASCSVIDDR